MFPVQRLVAAISQESLAGWLFYNLHHRDALADRILGVAPDAANTRPWICLVSAAAEPVKIVPAIESAILDHLPGRLIVYRGRAEFLTRLEEAAAALSPGGRWAADFSHRFPRINGLDHGAAALLQSCGFQLTSADNLIPNAVSRLTDDEISSHEEASRALHRVIGLVWDRIRSSLGHGPVFEGQVHAWIMELFAELNLETDGPLIVGAGKNTRLPHYFPGARGAPLKRDDVMQLDIWGKLKRPGAIYADISLSGVLARAPSSLEEKVFAAVAEARDRTVEFIAEAFSRGRAPTGAEADRFAVARLEAAGFGAFVRHRTGHSIDTEVHGSGVNLDSHEFPDDRPLAEGYCFSVEPGLYLDDFGIRTEIDVYIKNGRPVVSGGAPQRGLLLLKE